MCVVTFRRDKENYWKCESSVKSTERWFLAGQMVFLPTGECIRNRCLSYSASAMCNWKLRAKTTQTQRYLVKKKKQHRREKRFIFTIFFGATELKCPHLLSRGMQKMQIITKENKRYDSTRLSNQIFAIEKGKYKIVVLCKLDTWNPCATPTSNRAKNLFD